MALVLILTLLFLSPASSLSSSSSQTTPPQTSIIRKVVVAGASGRTGSLVVQRLLENPRFEPRALVRSEASGKKLRQQIPALGLDQIVVCDISSLIAPSDQNVNSNNQSNGDKSHQQWPPPSSRELMAECDAMIICTSAVPAVSKRSLVSALLIVPWNMLRRKKPPLDFRSLRFVWKYGGTPEMIDFQGQVALIDLALATSLTSKNRMKHVVLVSSMGGTDASNFLNRVGKNPDGTGDGDILLWKRKAERYLVESSSGCLDYTIIHPGGLVNSAAGQQDLLIDVDDKLLSNNPRSISRADVANLCISALTVGKGHKTSFDCISRPTPKSNGEQVKSADAALEDFLNQAMTYNYAL